MAEWNTPKTDWVTNPKNPVAEDFNRIEGNIAFLKQDIETKKGAIVNALNTVGLEIELTDTHAQIANKIVAANQGTKIYTPGTANITIPKGFHSGQGYVKGDPNLKANNIIKGVSIFGVVGNAIKNASASGTVNVNQYTDYYTLTISNLTFAPCLVVISLPLGTEYYDGAFHGIFSSTPIFASASSSRTPKYYYGVTCYYFGGDSRASFRSFNDLTSSGFSIPISLPDTRNITYIDWFAYN